MDRKGFLEKHFEEISKAKKKRLRKNRAVDPTIVDNFIKCVRRNPHMQRADIVSTMVRQIPAHILKLWTRKDPINWAFSDEDIESINTMVNDKKTSMKKIVDFVNNKKIDVAKFNFVNLNVLTSIRRREVNEKRGIPITGSSRSGMSHIKDSSAYSNADFLFSIINYNTKQIPNWTHNYESLKSKVKIPKDLKSMTDTYTRQAMYEIRMKKYRDSLGKFRDSLMPNRRKDI